MPRSASARAGTGGRFRPRERVRRSEEVVPIPAINGRPVISRADMAARGVPRTTVDGWYRDRARTGHPEKAGRIGRTDYWYEDEWTAWYEAHRRGKVESLTQVDRSGDPDDLVDAAEAARMLRLCQAQRDPREPPPRLLPRTRRLRHDQPGAAALRCGSGRPYGPRPTAARASGAAISRVPPARPPSRIRMPATNVSPASLLSSVMAASPHRRNSLLSGASASGLPSASSMRPGLFSKPDRRVSANNGMATA